MSAQPHCPRARTRRFALLTAVLIAGSAVLAGCADFAREQPTFTVQPSLTPPEARPSTEEPSSSSTSPSPSSSSTAPSEEPDPCVPTDPAVIAACLDAPWGLAVLPDGSAALVGERTTGRILQVAPETKPFEFATITGLDSSDGGGLLGLALSPSYDEDGLIYAFVTTTTDARILRLARGQQPKAIFTGIPRSAGAAGGRIAFDADRALYVGTGDGGTPALAKNPKSLAGKILRLDEFGKPEKSNTSGTAVFASGFSDVTGMCLLPGGSIGALDHRRTADVLFAVEEGEDYSGATSGRAMWTWPHAEGGASDCAVSGSELANTSLDGKQLVGLMFAGQTSGGFSGEPQVLLDDKYGRLLTVTVGRAADTDLYWMTTSNKDGKGEPVPADDRVIVLPAGGGGGEGGPD